MRRLKDAVVSVAKFVVIDPIREGSPQPRRWPWIGRLLAILTALICLAALLHIIGASLIRTNSDMLTVGPGTYLPVLAMPLLGIGVFTAMTLLQTAALHVHWILRIIALIPLAGVVGGAFLQTDVMAGWVAIGGFVALLVLHVARIGRAFSYLEVILVGILVFAITQVPILLDSDAVEFGYDMRGFAISSQLDQLNLLAVPALIMAGTALTQISVTVGEGAAQVAARKLKPLTVTALVAVLLLILSWQVVRAVLDEPHAELPRQILWSFVILAFAILFAAPFVLRARRRGGGELEPGLLAERFNDIWFLVAAGSMLVFLVPFTMISINAALTSRDVDVPAWAELLESLADHPYASVISRAAVALIGLVIAWRRARAGRWLEGVLLATFLAPSLLLLLARINPAAQWSHTPTTRDLWLWVAVVVTAVFLAGTGRLAGARLAGLLTAIAVMLLYPLRHFLADPISYLLGSIALASLIFGLTWRALTEGSFTRGSTAALPQPSRVLLYLANLLFAATVLARGALTRTDSPMVDPAQWEWLGDVRFAEPLYLGAVGISLLVAWVGPGWFAPVPSPAPQSAYSRH